MDGLMRSLVLSEWKQFPFCYGSAYGVDMSLIRSTLEQF